MNYVKDEIIKLNADGVVFCPIFTSINDLHKGIAIVYCEYTLEEIDKATYHPKSDRKYYKIINGKRAYYDHRLEEYIAFEAHQTEACQICSKEIPYGESESIASIVIQNYNCICKECYKEAIDKLYEFIKSR